MSAASSSHPRLSRRKRVLFAAIAIALTFVLAFLTLLGIDIYLHGKYQRSAGVNVWGYRGSVAGRKAPGEFRVAVFGGSTAFGYGVTWEESFPAVLARGLDAAKPGGYSVVNLAYNNEGAYSFKFTMQDYAYLHVDLALLYEGYNDLIGDPRGPNLQVFRHESPIFRATGYLPIFPIVFKEKAAVMLYGGDVGALYRDQTKTVFRPGLAARTGAEALNAAAEFGQSLERQLGRVTAEPPRRIVDVAATGCKYPWQEYCRSILEAVQYSLANGTRVLVVTQPYEAGAELRKRHQEQQAEMAAMLTRRFGGDPRVAYVNLGPVIEVADPALSFDRMHLTAAGNARLGDALLSPVMTMAAGRSTAGAPTEH
jgi:lysophospholipase L1-like esterase